MHKKGQQPVSIRKMAMPYVTSEMASVMRFVEAQIGDAVLVTSLHFSPTAMANVRRVMMSGGSIIADTSLAMSDIDEEKAKKLNVHIRCFIDDPAVIQMAAQRRITRAEIALDYALSQPGMKLILVGSAPMALAQLLKRRQLEPIADTIVIAMPTGFASVVQLKERLWDSDIPCIVARGKKGGTAAAVALLNGLMAESIKEQGLT